ncbi:PEP-CTERM sorting domain-containing protein [Alginatibacterium sediminis]|uniref:PEP-CTERM sorting domain-containing protein n=1 Tax=Alginatibacterium sediminis TaxID=2164068 RepID=A0A420EIE1_9ALTE|nr:PEP-CTERM sorting domain-containing protein [Alginatibacterium sediminis]RKF20336.1 PEP-CTERM sorting domain-containing protein [Alginatibacterium sediminis]
MFNLIRNTLTSSLLFFSLNANSAFITIDEAAFDAVFSQNSFGTNPVDIRIGKASEMVFPDLLNIDSFNKIDQLFAQHLGPANAVSLFFVDTVNWCGYTNYRFVGCGERFGNDYVVESIEAAGWRGTELLAHELGHNLGLDHTGGGNLMTSNLNGNTSLSNNQVAQILNSPLVQQQNDYRWIDINPILIVSQATPQVSEPTTLFLLAGALMLLFRRKIACHMVTIKR